jgi:ceramide glucosyltransferase
MFINDWFLPGAVTYERMRGLTTAFGETLCIRRSVLEAIGGFESVISYLADDTMIARKVQKIGYRLELSTTVVENVVDESDLRSLVLHEIRWARTLLLLEPVRYCLAFLLYPLPISVLAAAISLPFVGSPLPGLALVALALAARTGQHFLVRRLFRVRGPATPGLIPLRDALGFAIWLASFFGQSVHWRGVRFELDGDGKLSRQSRSVADAASRIPR